PRRICNIFSGSLLRNVYQLARDVLMPVLDMRAIFSGITQAWRRPYMRRLVKRWRHRTPSC
ncbi:MAG TPA: hypothetical protein VIT91_04615, partial [Chthoniobacterales bacterium]